MTTKSTTVAVIGGGVIGTSTLFHLASQHGVTDAVLFEKNQLASGSTSKAAGGVRNFFTSPGNIEIGDWSIEYFKNFEERVGVDLEFRQHGYIWLFHSDEARRQWEERVEFCRSHGVSADIIEPEEVVEHFPELDPDSIGGAVLASDCGHVDPSQVTQGFARAATDLGATVETGVGVTDVLTDGDAVTGVETTEGTWEADVVVNAAGPWAGRIGEMAGVDLPLELWIRRIMVTSPVLDTGSPLFIDHERKCYFMAEQSGSLLVCDMDQDEFDIENPDTVAMDDIGYNYYLGTFEKIQPMIPESADLDVINGWAGLQTHTPDGNAIIGSTPVDGFFVACGFSGHGVQQSPLVGTTLADIIVDGETSLFDLEPFSLEGFESGNRGAAEEMA